MNTFLIDFHMPGKKQVVSRLSKLVTTKKCRDNGVYHEAKNVYQVYLETTFTEDELEQYLYKWNYDYIGVVKFDKLKYVRDQNKLCGRYTNGLYNTEIKKQFWDLKKLQSAVMQQLLRLYKGYKARQHLKIIIEKSLLKS